MSTHDNGGPAFPIPLNPGQSYQVHAPCDGMTLRDYFAAKALTGMWANAEVFKRMSGFDEHRFAQMAYECADAMLKARGGAQ